MKKHFLLISSLFVSLLISSPAPAANSNEITAPVKAYFQALNASDKDAVMAQYGHNPVFMQQGAPAFVGREAISQAYDAIFTLLDLNVEFEILEVEQINDTMAIVRTHSAGKIHIRPQSLTVEEGNNELFIVKREDSDWKIYRYIFSNDNR